MTLRPSMALCLNRARMSIATKTGDAGTTALMYNRRVPKSDARVEAYGCVDELNAAVGLARATAENAPLREQLLRIQQDLVLVMGELATAVEDLERYIRDGYGRISPLTTAQLDGWVKEVESQQISYRGWATPGASVHSAALDMARTICRRAERRVCALQERNQLQNAEIVVYLNRLSDLLWLWARWVEPKTPPDPHTSNIASP
jgi:cob(I)alamin adenosyltransferase